MADQGFLSRTYADYDNERSNFRVRVPALTAANFDAQATLHNNLVIAIAGMVNGVLVKSAVGNEDLVALGPASDPATQRELKWLVQYHDGSTLRRYSVEMPCADTSVLDPNDRAHAHIGDAGPVDAFITAFQNVVLSPTGGAVVVDEITLVGRPV